MTGIPDDQYQMVLASTNITVGEPDRLLSSFINGSKRLPCEFG